MWGCVLESEIPDQKPILHISLGPLIGPSATRVDLTVIGVASNICGHTGITRRETAARVRAARHPDSSTTNSIKTSAITGHQGLLFTG